MRNNALLWLVTSVVFLSACSPFNPGPPPSQIAREQALESKRAELSAFIGHSFWVPPISAFVVKAVPTGVSPISCCHHGYVRFDSLVGFYDDQLIFHVTFEDGAAGYIQASPLLLQHDFLDHPPPVAPGAYPSFLDRLTASAASAAAERRKLPGVKLGMHKDEVLRSAWGKPEHVNRTTTAKGEVEKWSYGHENALYFKGDVLAEINN